MQSELEDLLNKAKILLKDEMTEIAFNTWIKPLEIQDISNDTITFIANSEFQEEAINKRLEIYEKQTRPLVDYYQGKGVVRTEEVSTRINRLGIDVATDILNDIKGE